MLRPAPFSSRARIPLFAYVIYSCFGLIPEFLFPLAELFEVVGGPLRIGRPGLFEVGFGLPDLPAQPMVHTEVIGRQRILPDAAQTHPRQFQIPPARGLPTRR